VQLSLGQGDHCNPAVAIDSQGTLYAAWQENERGVWSIRMSVSADGAAWSEPFAIADSNDNQVNPTLAAGVLAGGPVALAWQSDAGGNQDICVATSVDGFATREVARVTGDAADQTEPVLAVDAQDTIVVLWTDARHGSNDIYGAVSTDGAWTNVPVVSTESNQSQIAVATGLAGSLLHMAWVDDIGGDTDVFYAASEGLPTSPLTGVDLIDDESGADQQAPVLAVAVGADGTEQIFACWIDNRNGNADLYLADVSVESLRVNVLVDGAGVESNQYEVALGAAICGEPYMVWMDDANGMREVYCSATLPGMDLPPDAQDELAGDPL
jgi:hypothetical protein